MSLPVDKLDKLVLKEKLTEIVMSKTKEIVMKKYRYSILRFVAVQAYVEPKSIRRWSISAPMWIGSNMQGDKLRDSILLNNPWPLQTAQ